MASESSYENVREKSVKLRMQKYGRNAIWKRIYPNRCTSHYPYECECTIKVIKYDKHKSFVDAIKVCDIEVVMMHFQEGYDLSSNTDRIFTPLYYAVESGCKEIVELLLQKGADPHLPKGNCSPILVSTRQNNTEITELLLQNGADPNAMECSMDADNPLIYAIDNKNVRMVELLLRYKTRLYNHGSASPGYYGRQCGVPEIVDLINKYDTSTFRFH